MSKKKLFHLPVLSQEVLSELVFDGAKSVFDGTLGLGGHADLILNNFPNIALYYGTDLDNQHLEFAKKRLNKWSDKTEFFRGNFSEGLQILFAKNTENPLVILLDLGLCSNQVDNAEKGFSFNSDGPLKMAFDGQNRAEKIINTYEERKLREILKNYGEEPLAHKITKKIISAREINKISTTQELRKIIASCVRPQDLKKTLVRVFQAIRIEANDELNVLEKTITTAFNNMRSHDRLGIISYHSLEDRIVKNKFKIASSPKTIETKFSLHEVAEEASFLLLTKKPISPTTTEISRNPRSRSARLRIIQKK